MNRKVSSVAVFKDTDFDKTAQCIKRSAYKVFSIRLEDDMPYPIDGIRTLAMTAHEKGAMVMTDVRKPDQINQVSPDFIYMTEKTKERREVCTTAKSRGIPVLFRILMKSLSELERYTTEFRELHSIWDRTVLFIRSDNLNVNALVKACENLIDDRTSEDVCLLDVPLCLAGRFRVSAKALFDVGELISDRIITLDAGHFTSQYRKSRRYCGNCRNTGHCLGLLRCSDFDCLYPENSTGAYEQIFSVLSRMLRQDIDFGIRVFNPDDYLNSGETVSMTMNTMQACRVNRNFEGPDFFYIWDFEKSCYFNRPLKETELFRQDPRGLLSLNWQFIGKGIPELEWKHKCDLLLPHHGFNTTVKIKFNPLWTAEKQKMLDDLTFGTIIRVVEKHGGKGHIRQVGNDLLYDGKKFAGKEWLFVQNYGYIENTVVTCEYTPEKKYFEKLYHHPGERQITGITEELPSVTKELLMKSIQKALNSF